VQLLTRRHRHGQHPQDHRCAPNPQQTALARLTRQLHDHFDIEDQQQIARVDEESRSAAPIPKASLAFDRLRAEISVSMTR